MERNFDRPSSIFPSRLFLTCIQSRISLYATPQGSSVHTVVNSRVRALFQRARLRTRNRNERGRSSQSGIQRRSAREQHSTRNDSSTEGPLSRIRRGNKDALLFEKGSDFEGRRLRRGGKEVISLFSRNVISGLRTRVRVAVAFTTVRCTREAWKEQ